MIAPTRAEGSVPPAHWGQLAQLLLREQATAITNHAMVVASLLMTLAVLGLCFSALVG
jgi:hypothetical protein